MSNFLRPERLGVGAGYSLGVVVKISGIFKAQGIRNIGNIPVGMLQKCFCFTNNTVSNVGCSRLTGYFFYSPVQLINMHI